MDESTITYPERLLRLTQVLERIPVSKTAWYLGVKKGYYPAPLCLAKRTVVWKESDISDLITRVSSKMMN